LTVLSLLQKFYNLRNTPNRLLIKSAIAPDHLKGFIYIEADREAHVQQAIKGMRNLQQHGYSLVPIKDMVDVLVTSKKRPAIKKGDWIRIKGGIYTGDLAQVFDYEEAKGRVMVKMIPRIDYTERPERDETGKKEKKKMTVRPPAKFFNPDEARNLSDPPHYAKNEGIYYWRNNRYKDGYLLKSINIKTIMYMNITPTLEELQRFRSSPKGKENEDEEGIDKPEEEAPVPPLTQPRKVQFAKGDTVKVIEGDLKNLMGVVEAIDGDTVTIMPKHEQLHDLLKIPAGQLQNW
jgi:transcription elongation factor SPT5